VLEEIVGTALRRMEASLAKRTVSIDVPADLPLISVDGLLIELVLVNLLENAVRYTPAESPIEIAARVDGERVEIAIRDRGPGIPTGMEERIFEKFNRGTAISDSRRGVGLGLAVCRGMIEAHGGTITAHNRSGGGAEFVIHLPQTEVS
jgi:two-component system sensor histidine kinase KdpD